MREERQLVCNKRILSCFIRDLGSGSRESVRIIRRFANQRKLSFHGCVIGNLKRLIYTRLRGKDGGFKERASRVEREAQKVQLSAVHKMLVQSVKGAINEEENSESAHRCDRADQESYAALSCRITSDERGGKHRRVSGKVRCNNGTFVRDERRYIPTRDSTGKPASRASSGTSVVEAESRCE